jgi:CheY-like chemotaxis protein
LEPVATIPILLVDDQRFVGIAVTRLLGSEKDLELHRCEVAGEAIAEANRIRPALIFQDLKMPDIDGLSLVRLFRSNPATASTPIVVLSANDDPEDRTGAAAAGANEYLVKLPTRAHLVSCIRRHVGAGVGQ